MKLKKLISFGIILSVIFASINTVEAISDFSENGRSDYTLLLNRMGISAVNDENSYITRGDFTVLAMQASGMELASNENRFADVADEQSSYINTAAVCGFVKGNADELFAPERIITVEEAAIICLRILGYDKLERINNTYALGNASAAAKLELITGISSKKDLNCKDAALLIYNMLNSKYVDSASLSSNGTVSYSKSEKTYMNDKLDVYKYTGMVESVCGVALNGTDAQSYNHIKINKGVYLNEYYKDYSLIGRKVEYYAKHTSDGSELLYISSDYSKKEQINMRNVSVALGFDRTDLPINKKNPSLTYTDADRKNSKKASISAKATVILNGENTVSVSNSDFMKKSGRITLIDVEGNSSYDVVIIEQYEYYRVSAVENNLKKIFDKDGKEAIDIECFEKEKNNVFSNGEIVSSDSISQGSVLQVMCSYDEWGKIDYSKAVTVTIMLKSISGRVCAFEDEEIVYIDDSKYFILPQILSEIRLGDTCKFYLGSDNLIIGYDRTKQTDASLYGYIVASDKKGISGDKVKFKIYTSDNKMIVLDIAPEFRYTGEYNGDYVYSKKLEPKKAFEAIQTRQLVKYRLNAQGELMLIETAYDHTQDADYEGYDENRFSLEYVSANENTSSTGVNENYRATTNTIYFYVHPTSTDEADFTAGNFRRFGNGSRYAGLKVYDSDIALRPAAVVVETQSKPAEINDKSFFDGKYPAIITDKKMILNSNGDYELQYTVHYQAGPAKLVAYEENISPLNDYFGEAVTNVAPTIITRFEELDKGDIICYELDSQGKVSKFVVLYDYSEGEKKLYGTIYPSSSGLVHQGFINLSWGRVTKFYQESNFMLDCSSTKRYNYTFQPIFYYIYDSNTGELVSSRKLHYLDVNDYVFVYAQSNTIRTVILYKND